MKKIAYVLAAMGASAYALEFGTMGNVSASMGGAGVALKNSAFGLYYNPALLSASPKVKFGYSFGVNVQEKTSPSSPRSILPICKTPRQGLQALSVVVAQVARLMVW